MVDGWNKEVTTIGVVVWIGLDVVSGPEVNGRVVIIEDDVVLVIVDDVRIGDFARNRPQSKTVGSGLNDIERLVFTGVRSCPLGEITDISSCVTTSPIALLRSVLGQRWWRWRLQRRPET